MQGLVKINTDLALAKNRCDELDNLARAYRNYGRVCKISNYIKSSKTTTKISTSSVTIGYAISSSNSNTEKLGG